MSAASTPSSHPGFPLPSLTAPPQGPLLLLCCPERPALAQAGVCWPPLLSPHWVNDPTLGSQHGLHRLRPAAPEMSTAFFPDAGLFRVSESRPVSFTCHRDKGRGSELAGVTSSVCLYPPCRPTEAATATSVPLQMFLLPRTPFSLPLLTKGPCPSSVQLLALQTLPVLPPLSPLSSHPAQPLHGRPGPLSLAHQPASCLSGTRP